MQGAVLLAIRDLLRLDFARLRRASAEDIPKSEVMRSANARSARTSSSERGVVRAATGRTRAPVGPSSSTKRVNDIAPRSWSHSSAGRTSARRTSRASNTAVRKVCSGSPCASSSNSLGTSIPVSWCA